MIATSSIILFDGQCNLCNRAVHFIIKRDKKQVFKFASLQSSVATEYINQVKQPKDGTLVLIQDGRSYTQSDAALRIARKLSGLWPLCTALFVLPKRFRNGIYNWVARNRYQWFGKATHCWVSNPELQRRFL